MPQVGHCWPGPDREGVAFDADDGIVAALRPVRVGVRRVVAHLVGGQLKLVDDFGLLAGKRRRPHGADLVKHLDETAL